MNEMPCTELLYSADNLGLVLGVLRKRPASTERTMFRTEMSVCSVLSVHLLNEIFLLAVCR